MDYRARFNDAMELVREMKAMLETQDARRVLERSGATTTDTLITPATPEELAAYARGTHRIKWGKCWTGALKPMLDALDPETQEQVFKTVDEYRTSKKTTDSARDRDPLGRWHTAKLNSDLNAAARKRWNLPPVA